MQWNVVDDDDDDDDDYDTALCDDKEVDKGYLPSTVTQRQWTSGVEDVKIDHFLSTQFMKTLLSIYVITRYNAHTHSFIYFFRTV